MQELSYSFHIGNDKNKSKRSRRVMKNKNVKDNIFNNNAIQNARALSKVNKHNLRKYDNNAELINILRGSNNLYEDVKELYKQEFEEARLEYNKKQTRNDRKIDDYFTHISNNKKSDLACEIIIELGDMFYWEDKEERYKKKMNLVFEEQLLDLENIVPTFKIASAVVHYDESSPHLHIVGVPIKNGKKNGMKKQVGKSDIFTKDSLKLIQEKMRVKCISSFNKIYKTNMKLKTKELGRNEDIQVQNMKKYYELKKQNETNKKRLEDVNQKSNDTIKKTNQVKEIINNLKPTLINKENFTINQNQLNEINNYIDQVNNNVSDIKNVNDLTVILNDFENDLQNHNKQVQKLQDTIDKQQEEIQTLNIRNQNTKYQLNSKNKEIKELNKKISKLEQIIQIWQKLWQKLLDFFQDKFYSSNPKDKIYENVISDMLNKDILDNGDINYIENGYTVSKENDSLER